jgi:hypothetical protein
LEQTSDGGMARHGFTSNAGTDGGTMSTLRILADVGFAPLAVALGVPVLAVSIGSGTMFYRGCDAPS